MLQCQHGSCVQWGRSCRELNFSQYVVLVLLVSRKWPCLMHHVIFPSTNQNLHYEKISDMGHSVTCVQSFNRSKKHCWRRQISQQHGRILIHRGRFPFFTFFTHFGGTLKYQNNCRKMRKGVEIREKFLLKRLIASLCRKSKVTYFL